MRLLVAPDRFDPSSSAGPASHAAGGLTAAQAAAALRDGWASARPDDELDLLPLSDGGPGLIEAVRAARGGELLPVDLPAAGPGAVAGLVLVVTEPSGAVTAYVEAAHALPAPPGSAGAPGAAVAAGAADAAGRAATGAVTGEVTSGSEGLGVLLAAALATGAQRVVVGVGLPDPGVPDGGAGVLAALGLGSPALRGGNAALRGLAPSDLDGIAELRRSLRGRDLVVAFDHDLPVLGLSGASADRANRGLASPEDAQEHERALSSFVHLLGSVLDDDARPDLLRGGGASSGRRGAAARAAAAPGSGAGGGVGLVLGLLGARLVPGAAWVASDVGLAERIAEADLVVTATGTLDGHALGDGVVGAVTGTALPTGVPVIALAGELRSGRREWGAAGLAAAFGVDEGPRERARLAEDPAAALAERVPRVARTWSR